GRLQPREPRRGARTARLRPQQPANASLASRPVDRGRGGQELRHRLQPLGPRVPHGVLAARAKPGPARVSGDGRDAGELSGSSTLARDTLAERKIRRRDRRGRMTDRAAYDTIPARYDDVWGRRFEAVAGLIWERVSVSEGADVLDIGTGTAVVPRALVSRFPDVGSVTGCDWSSGMMRVARVRMPALRLVAADTGCLAFWSAVFGRL